MNQAKYDQRKTCLGVLVIIAVFLVVKVLFTTRHDKRLGYLSLRFHLVVMNRKKWVNVLSNFRRSGSGDNFNLNDCSKRSYVCEFHFNFV